MNKRHLMLSIAFACISLFGYAATQTDTIKVWGNCKMCKGKIEKAATAAGASSAEWNDETKLLIVSYDAAKTSNLDVQKKIAAVGYDTQDVKASDAAYKKLDKCCQYERPADKDSSSKSLGGSKDVHGLNKKCNIDCNTNDCCKTKFGKGYYYIDKACKHKTRTEPTIVLSGADHATCCI